MSDDVLALARKNLRGTDSNSLLRLYDLANGIFNKSPLQQEREAATRASAHSQGTGEKARFAVKLETMFSVLSLPNTEHTPPTMTGK